MDCATTHEDAHNRLTIVLQMSQVQEASAHAAAKQVLAEEAVAVKCTQPKEAKKQRQKPKRQQQQQPIMQAFMTKLHRM